MKRHLRIPQEVDLPVGGITLPECQLRYAYARSAESRARGAPGQDYLAITLDEHACYFALCDGTAGSFFGGLGARLLGDSLVDWLEGGVPDTFDANPVEAALKEWLRDLTVPGSAWVSSLSLPADLPPAEREALEQKRRQGSETTFAAGRLDLPGEESPYPRGRLVLAWLGDSRIRLWGVSPGSRQGVAQERTAALGRKRITDGRWSTARGSIDGTPRAFVTPLMQHGRPLVTEVMLYSGGLGSLDPLNDPPNSFRLQELMEATSKDASFLDLTMLFGLAVRYRRRQRRRGVLQRILALFRRQAPTGVC